MSRLPSPSVGSRSSFAVIPSEAEDLREAIRPRGVRAVALSPAKGLREAISSSHDAADLTLRGTIVAIRRTTTAPLFPSPFGKGIDKRLCLDEDVFSWFPFPAGEGARG